MIIRSQKNKDNPYTIINNQCLKNKSLSAKAKGIYAYVMSLPDDWKFYADELENHFTDGRDSIRAGLRELEENGYLEREQVKSLGKFAGLHYIFKETPETAFPSAVNPRAGNPKLLNTDSNKVLIKQNKKTKNASAIADARAALKDVYDPFWMESKSLDLIPSDESQRMFFSFLNTIRKHQKTHVVDGLQFAMRWLRYCLRKNRVPPGAAERRKFVIGEIKYSLDYIRDRGLEATEALAKFAINDDFWSGALFSLKNLYKAEAKRTQVA